MDNLEERLENEGFDEILFPQNDDAKSILTLFDRGFYLIAMTEVDDDINEC